MKRAILPVCLLASLALHALLFTCRFDSPEPPTPVLVHIRSSDLTALPSGGPAVPPTMKVPLHEKRPQKAERSLSKVSLQPLRPSSLQIEGVATKSVEKLPPPDSTSALLEPPMILPEKDEREPPSGRPGLLKKPLSTPSVRVEAMPIGDWSKPPYPKVARENGWEGEVLVLVSVGRDGKVSQVDVDRSSGYPVLDRSAEKWVKRWLFSPATVDGTPVEAEVAVPVRFVLERGFGG